MPSPKLRTALLIAFAVAAYVLTECGPCERCAVIDLAGHTASGR